MAVINYYCVNGETLGDSVAGGYLRDSLGSVTATCSDTAVLRNTYRYKPYGESLAKTGASADPNFRWVGTIGYRETSLAHSASYVRARHYGQVEGRWTTVDPLWPVEEAYRYANAAPVTWVDPSGMWIRKKGACGATIVTPEKGDRVGVVVGPGGTMIRGGPAIKEFAKPGEDCIAVNGGFFGEQPYKPGKPASPVGDVTDCKGKKYPDPRLAKGEKYPFKRLPVITPGRGGRISGRPPSQPGGAAGGKTTRTGACTDKSGNLISLVIIPSVDFDGFEDCMEKICPKGSVIVLLDGGGSSQVVTNPNHNTGRPVHNWIIICSD